MCGTIDNGDNAAQVDIEAYHAIQVAPPNAFSESNSRPRPASVDTKVLHIS